MENESKGNAEIMGKKIQCIGRYVMDGVTLGKGNFAKVELATHGVTGCKVSCVVKTLRYSVTFLILKKKNCA